MKYDLLLLIAVLCTGVAAGAQEIHNQERTAADVVSEMQARDAMRVAESGGYTGQREYIVINRVLQKKAGLRVIETCDQNGVKHFQIVTESGWLLARRGAVRNLLGLEQARSQPESRVASGITSENYSLRMIGIEFPERRAAYVIDVTPKRPNKDLFRGRIWVDAEDYALARVEGELESGPTVWMNRVHLVQDFYKCGQMWFPMSTTIIGKNPLLGKTEISIRYLEYQSVSKSPSYAGHSAILEAKSGGDERRSDSGSR